MSRALQAATAYLDHGFEPLPAVAGTKAVKLPGWQKVEITAEVLPSWFTNGQNVSIRTTDTLVDIDLDCPEAVHFGALLLPHTPMRHGRKGKPPSHYWYSLDEPLAFETWDDLPDADGEVVRLLELRAGRGHQTLVPPSTFIDDDGSKVDVVFVPGFALTPAEVTGRELHWQVRLVAAGTLLARHWPRKSGNRHTLALAVGGVLTRHGVDVELAATLVTEAAALAGDPEARDNRRQAVHDTAETLRAGGQATGIPTAKALLGEAVIERLLGILGIAGRTETLPVGTAPLLLPEPEEERVWEQLLAVTPVVAPEQVPGVVGEMLAYVLPYASSFDVPEDWIVLMGLPLFSAVMQDVKLQNLNAAIWALGIAEQNAGKNRSLDPLVWMLTQAYNHRRTLPPGAQLGRFSSGSFEGLLEAMVEDGDEHPCLSYQSEFAGFVETLRREFNSGVKEKMCDLYDGQPVHHKRVNKRSLTVERPHAAIVGTCTPIAARRAIGRDDLLNGWLSRFGCVLPRFRVVRPDTWFSPHDPLAVHLIERLTRFLDHRRFVRECYYETTGGRKDPPILDAYAEHLGMNSGELRTPEMALDAGVEPPLGRVFARAKKLAMVLTWLDPEARMAPASTETHGILLIPDRHIETAIHMAERYRAYATHLGELLVEQEDVREAEKILTWLRRHPENPKDGLPAHTARYISKALNLTAKQTKDGLQLLVESGEVVMWVPPGGSPLRGTRYFHRMYEGRRR